MKKITGIFAAAALALLVAGCSGSTTKNYILATGEQVELTIHLVVPLQMYGILKLKT